jgi:hypothetical protein
MSPRFRDERIQKRLVRLKISSMSKRGVRTVDFQCRFADCAGPIALFPKREKLRVVNVGKWVSVED